MTRPSQTPAPAPATPVTRSAMKTTADPGTDRVMVELGQQEEAKHEVSLARCDDALVDTLVVVT